MATKTRKDTLGDRMKRYEEPTRFSLPPRTYTLIRVDGKAFHSWTRGLKKPYDTDFMDCMDYAAKSLCENISGAQCAYVQSDEISILAVDFLEIDTQAWFNGNIQKWASVGASIATMAFNKRVLEIAQNAAWESPEAVHAFFEKKADALFDARVYTIPDLIEVENYFVWRQQDAERNSIMMLARAHATHKQLHGKKRADQHEIIHKAGDNWAKHPTRFKHGAVVRKARSVSRPGKPSQADGPWIIEEDTPVFTKEREYLRKLVPIIWNDDLLVRKATANG